MLVGNRQIVNIPPGVNKDDNSFSSLLYTDAQLIRFYKGLPETMGGWVSVNSDNSQTLDGVPRSIYSYFDSNGLKHTLIGTHTRLYSYENGKLYNITPLLPIGMSPLGTDPITTNGSNTTSGTPISTIAGSNTISITYAPLTQALFQVSDTVSISGAVGMIGNIDTSLLNTEQVITAVDATKIYFVYNTTVPSMTGTGGGAAVNIATKVITVTQTQTFSNGDRVGITGATTILSTPNVLDTEINTENIIRDVNPTFYSVYLSQGTHYATDSVAGGDVAVYVQGQIAAGNCTFRSGLGYGGGVYGAGMYGVPKEFTNDAFLPRIWSFDQYGNTVVLTPGDTEGSSTGGGIYQWLGDIATAPQLIVASTGTIPTAVNFLFVSNGQIVTFGAGGVPNAIQTSASDDITNWDFASGLYNAFYGTIGGAGRLIAHASSKDQQLIFTTTAVYSMQYVDKPKVWVIKEITTADGIIGPNALIEVNNSVLWCGNSDFYIYNGSVLKSLPNNSVKQWFFDNINPAKSYVSFARKALDYNEFWIIAPFGESDEPDTYFICNWDEWHYCTGNLSRTAVENTQNGSALQYMTYGACDNVTPTVMYQHEVGYSADGANLVGNLTTNYTEIELGDTLQQISRIVPSAILLPLSEQNYNGTLYNITCNTKEYDGSTTVRTFGPYDVTVQTAKIETRISGRQRQYIYNFATQQGFRIQKTYEEIKPSTYR